MLVLNDYNSHVTIDVVHKAKQMGLDFITLSSHTCHVFLLNVSCFKLFKMTFKTYKDVWTLVNFFKGVIEKENTHTMGVYSLQKNIKPT